tara:strand:- start:2366 stop:2911 length:546 start_codon:yes stop_codon:yes gene_type:complete
MANTTIKFPSAITTGGYSAGPTTFANALGGSTHNIALPADGSSVTGDDSHAQQSLDVFEGPKYLSQMVAPFDMRLIGMAYCIDISGANAGMTGFIAGCMKTGFNDMTSRTDSATWTTIGRITSSISGSAARVERDGGVIYSTDGYGKVSAGDGIGLVLHGQGHATCGTGHGVITALFEGQG